MEWYAERDTKVARDFVSEVRRVSALIAKQPGLGAPWNDARPSVPARRAPLTRFPYQIIYIEGIIIQIVALAHTKRRAGYWIDRLSEIP
jgi:plasmid stabilization system protein ParE